MQPSSPGKSSTPKLQATSTNKNGGNSKTPSAPSFFSQKKSPTLAAFLSGDQKIIGQAAVEKLGKKTKPSASDVRVSAQPCSGILSAGVKRGLHEVVPTNLVATVVKVTDDDMRRCLAEVQSGARISTPLAIFNQYHPKYQNNPNKQIACHNGVMSQPSAHTCGQAAAHDITREAVGTVISEKYNQDQTINCIINAQLTVLANGKTIMEDLGLTGEISSRMQIGKISAPLTSCPPSKNKKTDQSKLQTSRSNLSIDAHERREEVKARTRALKRDEYPNPGPSPDKKTRSPSPPRTPIKLESKTTFSGGEAKKGYERPLPKVPRFPKENTAAHISAWLTEPLRLDSKAPLRRYLSRSL